MVKHNKEFKADCIYLGDIEIDALYIGDECLYRVEKDEPEPDNDKLVLQLADNISEISLCINDKQTTYSDLTPGSVVTIETGDLTSCFKMFYNQFNNIKNIIAIPDTSNVTTMSNMFSNIFLDSFNNVLQTLDTHNVTDMSSMFESTIPFNTYYDLDLTNFDTSRVENMNYIFHNWCGINLKLGVFDVSALNWELSSTGSALFTFIGCENITGEIKNIKKSISISKADNLTRESALVFINGLVPIEDNDTQTLTFKADVYNRLLPEDIALATEKGWTIAG